MDESNSTCGPHTEIVKTEGMRITRCTCGTIHVTFVRNGLTVQLGAAQFAEAAQALALAKTVMSGGEPVPHPVSQPVMRPATPTGFITLPPFDPKKPSN
jgi:hypothetical protein